jgi:hypothetical protein
MKKQITNAMAVMAILGSSTFAVAGIQDIQGTWELASRRCTDGSSGQDRFQLGRDSLELVIAGSSLKSTVRVDGRTYNDGGNMLTGEHEIFIFDENGHPHGTFLYTLTNRNELVLFGAGFSKGGTCPQGEGIMQVFKRK